METIAIIIAAVAAILFCGALYKAFLSATKYPEKAFPVTVIARWHSDFVVRDKQGRLYLLPLGQARDVKVDDEITVENIPSQDPNKENLVNVPTPPYYVVATENATVKARVIRRLNKSVVFCHLGKDDIFVSCSLENQLKYQRAVSMVVGIKSDGNDRQILKCQDVLELPVCHTDGVFVIPECRQV